MTDLPSYKFIINKPYVGCWTIGGPMGLSFSQTRRPRWLTRMMAKWLFEWEWSDA